jgi:hypothetical protein
VILSQGSRITPLLSRSVITIKVVHPLLSGSLLIKSIDISAYILKGIGNGFRKPCFRFLQTCFPAQLLQFRTNRRTSASIYGQKNYLDSKAAITSLPGCPPIIESWVSWIIFVRRGLLSGTQRRLRNSNSPSADKLHSAINTLTASRAGNVLCSVRTALINSWYTISYTFALSYSS